MDVRELLPGEVRGRVGELAGVLVDCVEGGASVSFMWPMSWEKAVGFWEGVALGAERGERVVVVAEEGGKIVGTGQLVMGLPENQPHRGDVAKVLVVRGARGKGVGAGIMGAVEEAARVRGKRLLVLDTVAGEAGERLYERCGWVRAGVVPGYALWPDGRECDTVVFYKRL